MGALEQKVVVVVGGGRGVGRAVSQLCANEGASVVIDDTGGAVDGRGCDPDVAMAAARAITDVGGSAVACGADASTAEGLEELLGVARERYGRIDAAAYFATAQRDRTLLRMDDESFEAVLQTQLVGGFRFVRSFAKELVAQKSGGALLLGAGPAGFFGHARQSNGAAASGGVVGLVRSAAAELSKHGIRINALAPTARTRSTADLPLFQTIRADSLTPEHAAPVAAHLLSEAAIDVTGEVFGVAGGRVYGFRVSETTGYYSEGPPTTLEALRDNWRAVTRG